jgi:hypothetical protein
MNRAEIYTPREVMSLAVPRHSMEARYSRSVVEDPVLMPGATPAAAAFSVFLTRLW